MRAVWLILAAGFRRQWKSWLLLTVLIAVASGFVLASAAAGRRTDSAFPGSLGIAAGRAIWRAFAVNLGVVPVPMVQAWLIVVLAAGALLAANALAAVPALSAARSRPGPLLRTE